ncbi:L,D-transpeptidase [cf. Phormidesmis sp. LEGE 11477]|uniref:L,D-transpeptidase n=1 Tax=cf. Phormidesmis sp. LEGE 11477 TaxID=1828680 RepID=UPI001881F344|nr:L,D-transpeptidase [cf. Phormidesmis sp. LEGE 11477]MBE9062699.1 L,D-transpeptidase [cf. Phormidesmis sp. LEGE 11477]
MQRQSPITRCFVGLCFGSAMALAALEWRNPFPDPVITPENLSTINESINESQSPFSRLQSRLQKRELFSGRQPNQPKAAEQSPVTLRLSLSGRYLEVESLGKPVIRYEVAVGQTAWQTPVGSFTVTSMIEQPTWQHPLTKEDIPPGPDNPLGDRWIGFWTDGKAQIGFHGTNQEELIGQAVSHGCVRMRNRDIRDLYERVELGVAVEVFQ